MVQTGPPVPAGAGIHVRECDTIDIRRVQVRRKEYGLRFSKGTVEPMPWNVADVLSLDGAYFSYCGWSIHVDGWLGNAKLRNIWSYLAAYGWLFKSGTIGQYDWNIADVTSQADGWNSSAAPLYLATAQARTRRYMPCRLCRYAASLV